MTVRVQPTPALLQWAIERSGKDAMELFERFPKLAEWLEGSVQPTVKQLEQFTAATYTSFGQMFLNTPPDETVSLPDFRTPASTARQMPSVHLLDTIHSCEARQEWYRNHLQTLGEEPLSFVGSVSVEVAPTEAAAAIAEALEFSVADRAALRTWDAALTQMVRQAEQAGVMVMRSGIVGNNTSRPLDNSEFSGFAMADALAPLIFINGKDSRARQMFTLAHELAHIWLGESGLSLLDMKSQPARRIEKWCDQVAAELLVPMQILRQQKPEVDNLNLQPLARHFKVSTLVILRRLHDGGFLDRSTFWQMYATESERLQHTVASSGGDFYRAQVSRTSALFASAVVTSAMEGQTLYRDAYQMLGIRKQSTFNEMARSIGVMI